MIHYTEDTNVFVRRRDDAEEYRLERILETDLDVDGTPPEEQWHIICLTEGEPFEADIMC